MAEIFVIDKQIKCPVCECDFTARIPRDVRLRMVGTDTDLRPHYEPIDPIHYDVLVCPYCGYAATSMNFNNMTERLADRIKNAVTPNFTFKQYPPMYDAAMAVERYEQALKVHEAKGGSVGERGYIYLKMGWMYRELEQSEKERECMALALPDLTKAYETERFPICGMSEATLGYLLGEMERRAGNEEEALKWFGKALTDGLVPPRIKERARDQKELIMQDRLKREQQEAAASQPGTAEEQQKAKKRFGLF